MRCARGVRGSVAAGVAATGEGEPELLTGGGAGAQRALGRVGRVREMGRGWGGLLGCFGLKLRMSL